MIYVAPHDDAATDGEHPPVYMLNMDSRTGENRCAVNKIVKTTNNEIRTGVKFKSCTATATPPSSPAKTTIGNYKTDEKSASGSSSSSPLHKTNKSGFNSSKSSPVRTVTGKIPSKIPNLDNQGKTSNPLQMTTKHEEQWIDGPRISKQKVAEARNLLLKENNIKKETWVDGPMQKPAKVTTGNGGQSSGNYGFMDNHKKIMIRKWVENQTVHLKQSLGGTSSSAKPELTSGLLRSSEPTKDEDDNFEFKKFNDFEDLGERKVEGSSETIKPEKIITEDVKCNVSVSTALIKQTDKCLKELKKAENQQQKNRQNNCGESSESSEEEKLPPPPLPLILRYNKDIKMSKKFFPLT